MSTHTPAAVVAGVDGSEPAAAAARAAAREAHRRGLPLRLVRAFHWPAGDVAGLPHGFDARAASRRSARADLDRLRAGLGDLLPARSIGTELLDGRAETVLCTATHGDDLLVVRASGLTGGPGNLLGWVSEAVAGRASCPVLVHREPNSLAWRRRGVVVGVDGAAGSSAVLAAAATEAQLLGAPLTVVRAWCQLTEDAVLPLRWRLDRDASTRAETAAVEPLVAQLRESRPDVPVTTTVRQGRPGRVLVQATQEAALLVVGRRDIAAGGPGATVHSVLHRTEVPVLVVPVPAPVLTPAPRTGGSAAAPVGG